MWLGWQSHSRRAGVVTFCCMLGLWNTLFFLVGVWRRFRMGSIYESASEGEMGLE